MTAKYVHPISKFSIKTPYGVTTALLLLASIFLISSFSHALALPAAAKVNSSGDEKKIDCLTLRQRNKLLGECDVVLSKLGLHMTVRKTNLIVLCLPPYNEVVCYALTSGKVWRSPIKSFRNAFSTSMTIFASFTLENVPLAPNGRVTEKKLDLIKLETSAKYGELQHKREHVHEIGGLSAAHLILLAADKLPYDKRIVPVLERMYALPKTGFFPISVHYQSVTADDVIYLSTAAAISGKIDRSVMQIPANLKPARAMQELLETNSSPEAIDLMMSK